MALAAAAALATKIAPIVTVLSGAASFASSAQNIASKSPAEPSPSLNKKKRWLVCTVKNMTDFPILTMADYFSSGRYDTPPQRIEPFSVMTFTCCEGDNTIMQGVTGGHSFYINLDNNHQFYFGLGYCNPYAGGYKAGVHKASNEEVAKLENDNRAAQAKIAQKAYDESDGSGNMIKSELYSAKDKDGKSVIFQFQISASVGAKPVYIISEIRDYQTLVSKA